jgi:hypothetical protein
MKYLSTSRRNILTALFLLLSIGSSYSVTTINLTEKSGSIFWEDASYSDNMNVVYNINTGVYQPITINYSTCIEPEYDYFEIVDISITGVETTILYLLNGNERGSITTPSPSGRAKIIFRTNESLSFLSSGYQLWGADLHYSLASTPAVFSTTTSLSSGNATVPGNLGVGVTNPSARLHVFGLSKFDGQTQFKDTAQFEQVVQVKKSIRGNETGGALKINTNYGYLTMGPQNGSFAHFLTDRGSFYFNKPIITNGIWGPNYDNINFIGGTIIRMTLTSDGKLGIGTTTPGQTLSVKGGLSLFPSTTTPVETYAGSLKITQPFASGQYINLTRASALTSWSLGTMYNTSKFAIGQSKTSDADFTSPSFVIETDGKVGIGTSWPSSRLHILQNSDEDPMATLTLQGTATPLCLPGDKNYTGRVLFTTRENQVVSSIRAYYSGAIGAPNYYPYGALVFNVGNADNVEHEAMRIKHNGNIGVGITDPQYKLDVAGTIRAAEVKVVSIDQFADFVFEKDYALPKLNEVHDFIQTNGHLPGIPSAKEVKQNGVNLVEMQVKLLQKVEELTLYSIQQQKRIDELERLLKEKAN